MKTITRNPDAGRYWHERAGSARYAAAKVDQANPGHDGWEQEHDEACEMLLQSARRLRFVADVYDIQGALEEIGYEEQSSFFGALDEPLLDGEYVLIRRTTSTGERFVDVRVKLHDNAAREAVMLYLADTILDGWSGQDFDWEEGYTKTGWLTVQESSTGTSPRRDTETTCHCGAGYRGSDHCPECGCEQYETGDCGHEAECDGHPGGPYDPMGATVFCDGTCKR